MAAMTYDRREQDLGNILLLEHVNVRVPDQQAATLFYIAGLGLTRDPYLMVSVENMWANAGQTQFHLPTGKPNVVQGHVDGVGSIISLQKIKFRDDWRLVIELPSELSRYVVPQGSITIEGISLTVAGIEGSRVEIAIIPHTWQSTNLRALRDGDPVNIEVDVLAKYAEKMAHGKTQGKLTAADLIKQGF